MLKVNIIYPAFMGEVNCKGIGVPCTFIRLSGCNLNCYRRTKRISCDTPEALSLKSGDEMSESDILKKVKEIGNNVICLTGGEPLLQDVDTLLKMLSWAGFNVVVETNGSKSIVPYRHIRNVSFVVDYKSKSTGETSKMLSDNWAYMNGDDYLKFVIDTYDDYTEAREWVNEHKGFCGNIAFGCFWGSQISYMDLMRNIQRDKLNVYLNAQTHKLVCLYDREKDLSSFNHIFIPKNL